MSFPVISILFLILSSSLERIFGKSVLYKRKIYKIPVLESEFIFMSLLKLKFLIFSLTKKNN